MPGKTQNVKRKSGVSQPLNGGELQTRNEFAPGRIPRQIMRMETCKPFLKCLALGWGAALLIGMSGCTANSWASGDGEAAGESPAGLVIREDATQAQPLRVVLREGRYALSGASRPSALPPGMVELEVGGQTIEAPLIELATSDGEAPELYLLHLEVELPSAAYVMDTAQVIRSGNTLHWVAEVTKREGMAAQVITPRQLFIVAYGAQLPVERYLIGDIRPVRPPEGVQKLGSLSDLPEGVLNGQILMPSG